METHPGVEKPLKKGMATRSTIHLSAAVVIQSLNLMELVSLVAATAAGLFDSLPNSVWERTSGAKLRFGGV